MSFCSLEFGLFVLIVFILYYLPVRKDFYQNLILTAGSLVFAFLYDKVMGIVFVLTIGLTWWGGIRISQAPKKMMRRRRLRMIEHVVLDILVLLLLKYSSFFSTLPGLTVIGTPITDMMHHFSLVLPIGISFYTLSLVSYLVDVFRGTLRPEMNPLDFTLFASYFPHILQGPIARYKDIRKQIRKVRKFNYTRMVYGLQLVLWGLIKKMVIADRCGIFVDSVYSSSFTGSGTEVLIASLLYTVQIYADFSGCVDIARGVSELFGISLKQNFDVPYMSASINEFWRRWHLSLSLWFRDYVYIPLGGNRKGKIRRWLNVLIVFLVSGFWHGAGLNFIVWGLLHGVYQVFGALWTPLKNRCNERLVSFSGWNQKVFDVFFTFNLVSLTWIFFRSDSIQSAWTRICQIFTKQNPAVLINGTLLNHGISFKSFVVLFLFIILMVTVDLCNYRGIRIAKHLQKAILPVRWIVWAAAIVCLLVWGVYGIGYNAADFIYMKF